MTTMNNRFRDQTNPELWKSDETKKALEDLKLFEQLKKAEQERDRVYMENARRKAQGLTPLSDPNPTPVTQPNPYQHDNNDEGNYNDE